MKKIKNILFTPLDWGLGHATRCIPIIKQLESEFNIFIATSGGAAELLKNEFPQHKHLSLPSYHITYPVNRKMSIHMALHLPSLISTITQERKKTNDIIQKHSIDLVISDNRFGCYSNKIPSIFITHQINIKSPSLSKVINRLNHKYIKKYNFCWIPDFENEINLGGDLSHPSLDKHPCTYIGALTRFENKSSNKLFDITVVISGPEPQRTIFEDLLFQQLLKLTELKINVVRGIYSTNELEDLGHIQVYDHLETSKLQELLHQSKNVICRSGYSSLMDLQKINAKILFVPTPQQTEQEYLAKIHSNKNNTYTQLQNELNIEQFLSNPNQERKLIDDLEFDFIQWIKKNIPSLS